MKQAYRNMPAARYMLQPGDSSVYNFSIMDHAAQGHGAVVDPNNEYNVAQASNSDLCMRPGLDVYSVVIHSPYPAAFDVSLRQIEAIVDGDKDEFSYLLDNHTNGNADKYTVLAVILAASVLTSEKSAVIEAGKRMLLTRDLLAEMQVFMVDSGGIDEFEE